MNKQMLISMFFMFVGTGSFTVGFYLLITDKENSVTESVTPEPKIPNRVDFDLFASDNHQLAIDSFLNRNFSEKDRAFYAGYASAMTDILNFSVGKPAGLANPNVEHVLK